MKDCQFGVSTVNYSDSDSDALLKLQLSELLQLQLSVLLQLLNLLFYNDAVFATTNVDAVAVVEVVAVAFINDAFK